MGEENKGRKKEMKRREKTVIGMKERKERKEIKYR